MNTYLSKSLTDTENIAEKLLEKAKDAPVDGALVIALTGDLGAGKTALTQAMAKKLNIKDAVKSPTFIIMESYPISFGRFHQFIHIDAYRMNDQKELASLGFAKLASENGNLIILEWPEKAGSLVPQDAFHVNLLFVDKNTREIRF